MRMGFIKGVRGVQGSTKECKTNVPANGVFLALFILYFLSSCARQGYPTGGPKDEAPPVALGCKPANESHHFAAKEFYIQFDEYVVLKNVSENVLVSPPMKEKPEFTTKGKGVLVKIKDTLQANTTYLFQFKEAIADFTEGNMLSSYEYVFSTGDAMDTLCLSGRVLDARTGKPWKETVTVMAYKDPESDVVALDDTTATFVQPDFVTRCDKEGHFAFHYIPAGRYCMVALEDKNRNLRIDPADPAAWDTTRWESRPVGDSLKEGSQMFISTPDNQVQRIVKGEFSEPGRITINTLLPMQHPSLEGAEMEWRMNAKRDTLWVWCLDAKCDSARIVVSDQGLQDTLKLRYTAPRKGSRRTAGVKEEKKPLMKALCEGNAAYYDDLRIRFENPIVEVADSAQAEIMNLKDSAVVLAPIVLDSNGILARIDASLKSGESYKMHLGEGLFTDIYGNRSDSLTFNLTPKDYGILSIDIDNRMGAPLVVEVLDKRDTVVQQQPLSGNGKLRFIHLPSGDYRLRAVVDKDSNGRWTPGDYRRQRQPEKTLLFEKTLNLRERWEMEERWVVEPPKARPKEALKAREIQNDTKTLHPEMKIEPLKPQGAQ